jgi:hypothetical protein
MTTDEIITRVMQLSDCAFDEAAYAADVADIENGDGRTYDELVADCLNALGI